MPRVASGSNLAFHVDFHAQFIADGFLRRTALRQLGLSARVWDLMNETKDLRVARSTRQLKLNLNWAGEKEAARLKKPRF